MSELAAHYKETTLEPDENTLINALRNQDDIPILMDVVTDKEDVDVSDDDIVHSDTASSEPMGLAELVAEELREDHEEQVDIPVLTTPEVTSATGFTPSQPSEPEDESTPQTSEHAAGEPSELQEAISIALAEVLQKRLPELVEEVLQLVNERVSSNK